MNTGTRTELLDGTGYIQPARTDGTENDGSRLAPSSGRSQAQRRRLRFSIGGLGIAGLLVLLGVVMTSNANFSKEYVTEQLQRQRITFKAVDALTEEERKSACVVANAGQLMSTGPQAECYANDFIGLHVQSIGKGRTYAELGDVQTALRGQVAAAQANGDPNLANLQKELTDLTAQRELVFKAEMLRGALLTSFGFSELGAKGAQAATAAYAGAGLIGLISLVGIARSVKRPRAGARSS